MTTTIDADATPRTRFSVVEMTRTPPSKSVVDQERGGHEHEADHGQRQQALDEVRIDAQQHAGDHRHVFRLPLPVDEIAHSNGTGDARQPTDRSWPFRRYAGAARGTSCAGS